MLEEKFNKLNAFVKCSYSLTYNEFNSFYDTPKSYWFDPEHVGIRPDVIQPDKFSITEDIWEIHVYPNTPVMFFHGIANNLEALLDWAIGVIEEDRNVSP
jgi:hypothetical protein